MIILTLKTFSIVFQWKCFINPLRFSNPLAKYVLQDRVLLRWPNSPQLPRSRWVKQIILESIGNFHLKYMLL